MSGPIPRASFLLLAAASTPAQGGRSLPQADLQVRTLEVVRSRGGLSVRVVVYTEHDHEARDAHVVILLPAGVGVERLPTGCSLAAGRTVEPAPRATIACELGEIADRGFREVLVLTTLPAQGAVRRLGVFAYSATPDPVPGNNYAERTIP